MTFDDVLIQLDNFIKIKRKKIIFQVKQFQFE
jgi:hypothetical protein